MIKVCLVTGAGSGIGRGVALRLSEQGHLVYLVGRRADALADTKALGSAAGEMIVCPCDVTDEIKVKGLYDGVRERGRLDVVFNNAGVSAPSIPVNELPVAEWRRVIDTNLTGAFLVARGAFGVMREQTPQGGRIINNGSVSASAPRPNSAPYTASKHAMTGLTKSLSLDGRRYNIACGQIDIGNAATDMAAQIAVGVPQADGSVRGEPVISIQDVANTVAHMVELPLEANVQFVTLMATAMPLVGRG
jgi:NAD(P)-dependent dehydrogenase (short-subunit alcohol dehydrogenase family)